MRWGGGVKIFWYDILTPPPSKNIQEQYLYMESSDNLASTHKTFTYHRHSIPWMTFLLNGMWGGVNILYCILLYDILSPPPPPPTNIQEHFFVNGIQ